MILYAQALKEMLILSHSNNKVSKRMNLVRKATGVVLSWLLFSVDICEGRRASRNVRGISAKKAVDPLTTEFYENIFLRHVDIPRAGNVETDTIPLPGSSSLTRLDPNSLPGGWQTNQDGKCPPGYFWNEKT